MKLTSIAAIVVIAMGAGIGGGYILWPRANENAPSLVPAEAAQPTDAEATAAARRYKDFFGPYPNAEVKLGECSANGSGAGTMCMVSLTVDGTKPKAKPISRPMGFAHLNGQWEVSIW